MWTPHERIPWWRTEISRLLDDEGGAVEETTNLFSAGLDSLAVMTIAAHCRYAGIDVDYARLADDPTLAAWSALLPDTDPRAAGAPDAGPVGADEPAAAFPLTPVQGAYWVGRQDDMVLGGVGCHAYLELDGVGVVPDALERAVLALTRRHDMLRARFTESGEQWIAEDTGWPGLHVEDLRADAAPDVTDRRLRAIRDQLSHRVLDVGAGEVFDVRLTLLPGGRTRLHVELDMLVADLDSLRILLQDLAALYRHGDAGPTPAYDFRRYLTERAADRDAVAAAERYWSSRLDDLPAGGPQLPLATSPDEVRHTRFERRSLRLHADERATLRARAREHGLTPAMVLVGVYAEILAAWSGQDHFLLSAPLFDRLPLHPDVARLVADFSSVALLEIDRRGDPTFLDAVRSTQDRFGRDVSHAERSAMAVLADLGRRRGEPVTAPVVFSGSLGPELVGPEVRDVLGELGWMISQTPQVWLDHQVYDDGGGLLLVWDAVPELFPDGVLDAMTDAYRRLLEWLLAPGADWSAPLPSLLPPGQQAVRDRSNGTATVGPATLLTDAAVARAVQDPAATAVVSPTGTLCRGEVVGRALALAERLRAAGLTRGEHVAVLMDKGWEQVVAVLGIALAGAAYVPVDLAAPPARRTRILDRAGVAHAVAQPWVDLDGLPPGLRRHDVERADGWRAPSTAPVPAVDPDATAYVIFTSGTTGEPKGVRMSHRAAMNTVADIDRRFGVGPDDRVLGLANLGFDLSVYDVFGVLGAGGALVLPDREHGYDPAHWAELVAAHRVTIWNTVPAQWQMLQDHLDEEPGIDVSSVRLVMLSGDWIPVTLPDRVRTRVPGARVVSLGGATEAGIWSIAHDIVEVDPDRPSIPYGTPLDDQSVHVLGPGMRTCPDWTPGELHIGGASLAQGYLGDPELTAARFVTRPGSGERLYRTGDLGRARPDGEIEILGRVDLQVKVHGYRVELGEIESTLERHPAVRAAAVVAVGPTGGSTRLVAHVVARAGETCDPDGLRRFLGGELPPYSVPAAVIEIDDLPLGANGKVDRVELARRATDRPAPPPSERPATEFEQRVAAIWREFLDERDLGVTDDFFLVGGDSLVAARLTRRLAAELGLPLTLRRFLAAPTIAGTAEILLELLLDEVERTSADELAEAGR